jgi:hemolysin activation/secretion protein
MPATRAWAQASSPAAAANQEFLRQQERERALRQQQEQAPDVRLQDQPAPPQLASDKLIAGNEAPCFTIERIVLAGDSAERFQWATVAADRSEDGSRDSALHRCIGTQGINLVMRRIQNAILKRGFVTTRVLAGPQDLAGGTLTLTLIPGRVRNILLAPGTDPRATKWNALPLHPGDLLNLRDIEQALENFKRVPTADADIRIVPANATPEQPQAATGESDLVIQWKQGFPFRLSLSADDSGTRATGKYLGTVTVSYDDWWTLNDLFYVSSYRDLGGGYGGDRGTRGHTVHYSLPFGYWTLGLTTSQSRYNQSIAGLDQAYVYSGESGNSEIKLSRVIYRDAMRKSTLSIAGWSRSSRNYVDDTEVEVQHRRMAGWQLGANHREFIDATTFELDLGYLHGTGAFNALPAPEEAFGEGTSRPSIITTNAQLNIPFALGSQPFRFNTAWRAQWNRTPLVPQDRFAIAGRYTVRGFDGENLLSAEHGWVIRNDLGWTVPHGNQELYIGVDYGQVGGASSSSLVGRRLSGAVLGLRGGYKGFSYDFFVGMPVYKPEGFTTAGAIAGFNLNWTF